MRTTATARGERRPLLCSQLHVAGIARLRRPAWIHGSRQLRVRWPEAGAGHAVDVFSGQHTNALDRATRGGAPCSTSYAERSDRSEEPVRPVAVQNGDNPTNAHPGGIPLGQARVGLP